MIKRGNDYPDIVKEDFKTEISQYSKHILPAIDQKLKSKVQNNIFGKSLKVNRAYVSDDELVFIPYILRNGFKFIFENSMNYASNIKVGSIAI